ncbi:MAG: hypothetical protein V7K27_03105 [Nostoc sp.]|uniref:hypothetical protein n=1 Tax=Nostoc sp. TaxID=1180 RepID=UPI002FF47EEB
MNIGVSLRQNPFKISFPARGWKCSYWWLCRELQRRSLNEGHSQSETLNETKGLLCHFAEVRDIPTHNLANSIKLGLPLALAGMFRGISFFFLLAADILIYNRVRIR